MQSHHKKRIDIMIEQPLLRRMLELLDDSGVKGYTVLPVLAGKGVDGAWHVDGTVGRAGSLALIFCIVDEARINEVLDPVFSLVQKQIGIVTISDVAVIRKEQF